MTLVNHETGEILDRTLAEKRAQRIGLDLDGAAERFEAAMEEMRAAIRDRDDIALGYRSPGDYLSDRFGGKLARLGVDLRREVVRELTAAGMSTRTIAPIIDVSPRQVVTDRRPSRVKSLHTSPSPQGEEASTASTSFSGSDERTPDIEVTETPRPAVVIGIDGKKYPAAKPQPTTPKRKGAGHAVVLSEVVTQLRVVTHTVVPYITDLDESVTDEEAARLMGDLSKARSQLSRVINLLKERTK